MSLSLVMPGPLTIDSSHSALSMLTLRKPVRPGTLQAIRLPIRLEIYPAQQIPSVLMAALPSQQHSPALIYAIAARCGTQQAHGYCIVKPRQTHRVIPLLLTGGSHKMTNQGASPSNRCQIATLFPQFPTMLQSRIRWL